MMSFLDKFIPKQVRTDLYAAHINTLSASNRSKTVLHHNNHTSNTIQTPIHNLHNVPLQKPTMQLFKIILSAIALGGAALADETPPGDWLCPFDGYGAYCCATTTGDSQGNNCMLHPHRVYSPRLPY
jgi:hypothetical protein